MEAQRVRAAEVAIDQQSQQHDGITQDRQQDLEGGMRFFIPGFARDDQHTILLRLRVPAGMASAGPTVLADVELRYKDRVRLSNEADERRITVSYAGSQDEAQAGVSRELRRTVLTFRTGQALMNVAGLLTSGEQGQAIATLYERAEFLRLAAADLHDEAMLAEAARLDAFRDVLAQQGTSNALMYGSILRRAGGCLIR
jgi:Ca-activated chloride channel family protein